MSRPRRLVAGSCLGIWLVVITPVVGRAQQRAPSPSSQPAGSSDSYRLGRLVSAIGQDFRHLPSKDVAVWLGVATGVTLVAHQADQRVSVALTGRDGLRQPLAAGAVLGGAAVQAGAAAATYVIGLAAHNAGVAELGTELVRAQVLTGVLTTGLKLSIRRTRPDGGRYSFPSGHTSASFASAAVLQRHLGWKVGLPAYAVAGYVGMSRIEGNHHYLSDVVFGAALGLLDSRTVTAAHGRRQVKVQPAITLHSASVLFVACPAGR